MPGSVNTEFILDMQRKLYRWSHADPDKGFADLFNVICDRRTLAFAWRKLTRSAGSNTPGVDGLTRRKVEGRPGGVAAYLEGIREELRAGTYRPKPVRERLIPKPGKPGKFRPLGIPTLKDRLVQMVLMHVLEPIFEADFYPTSYGFRRGRSTHDAIASIRGQLQPTRAGRTRVRYVVEGDIKGCFDAIDHHLLMERVRRRIRDRKVLRLIGVFLKAGILAEGMVRHPVTGTPQGGVISPLLANVYLTALDERYRRWTPAPRDDLRRAVWQRNRDWKRGQPTFYLVRYADDFVILVAGSQDDAEAERERLARFLEEELRMELSLEKTLVTAVEEGFTFLGYRVVLERSALADRPVGKGKIPVDKAQAIRRRIKAMTTRATTSRSLSDLLRELNPIVTGWRTYYRYAVGARGEFAKLDHWLWRRLFIWLKKKHPRTSSHVLRRRFRGTAPASRGRWGDEGVWMRRFQDGGTARYALRGIRISNGWNRDRIAFALPGANDFWPSFNTLSTALAGTAATAAHGEPDAGKLARPVRRGG
ncbi:group II intron reverse transcriptase/maturase [Inquilinus limosus]|uniref:group II intron reverse transcriptase/maturase n=1 Tax=Inquilinus limosus TaxID=171674 RepID=UPI00041A6C1A|nr:group II intron reverse transcriptase/maturase [Inquilinus limosus]